MNTDRKKNKNVSTSHSEKYWGIDISSTKIEGIIIDPAQPNKVLCRLHFPTERFCGYDHVISQVQLLITELESISGINRPQEIGIATAGVIHPSTGILRNASMLCLNGHALQTDLSVALNARVLLANDANCFTLGEALLGAGRGYNVVMGLILDIGVGSGIVVGNYLLQGLHGIAGEWGHNKMHNEDILCHCGKKGCNEMVFSEFALERFYEELTGEGLSLLEIVKRAKQNEVAALKTLERLQDKFAEAIAVSINNIDPEVIIISGSVGAIDLLYMESTRAKILRYIFNKELKTSFLRPVLGDSAGALGAALLSSRSVTRA